MSVTGDFLESLADRVEAMFLISFLKPSYRHGCSWHRGMMATVVCQEI